jgi:hypothetical protein
VLDSGGATRQTDVRERRAGNRQNGRIGSVKRLGKSFVAGLAAFVISLALGLWVVPRTVVRTNVAPEPKPSAAPTSKAEPDDFKVITSERLVSLEVQDTRYVLPISVAVFVVTTMLVYHRARPA